MKRTGNIMIKTFLGKPSERIVNWCKRNHRQLVITSTDGNECEYRYAELPLSSSLAYVDKNKNVLAPFSGNPELSAFDSVARVVDCGDEIREISSYAFENCANLSSIECPGVSSIGTCAFNQCKNLSSVDFPNVRNIDFFAFYNCVNLSSIKCPNAQKIWNLAFFNCSNLFSIECPNVTSIGDGAFYYCTKLSSVYITGMTHDGITVLGGTTAFGNKRSWPVSVYVPLSCYDLIIENNTWEALTLNNTITLIGV